MNNIALLIADHGYELERAADLASRLYTHYPKDPAVVDTMGWVLFKQGKLDQALPLLRFAATGAPNNPVHRYHYGAALLKVGQTAAGRKELETALKISRDFDGAAQARALLGRK
jgi:predicted Zn-dependent protease